ncbi:MAG TPA: insulinase family protein, partial [Chloroflexota bacterium]|nr:insulinase family protein [Chloroflexota bacterium]
MAASVQVQTLGNGLMVLTREVHDAPVATFWTWYRVGSRNEVPGITGISHWVEHMMFKGTANLGKGEIFRSVSKNGGTLNGFTWIDYTTYFETLPSNRLDLAIQIEADRMCNSAFSPEEVESERTVIISEREGDENFPTSHLDEEVTSAAFKCHPYGHPVIGWKSDLLSMTRQELYDYYRAHYVPNNAVVVAVGDFSTDQLLKKIEQQFGGIPRGPEARPVRPGEPRQEGERKVVVRRPGPAEYFMAVYHAPAADSPDVFPLLVLDAILSGAKPMGLYSGRDTAMGRSSRLYRQLVDTGLCTGAGSSFGLTRDPYLFGVSASLQPQAGLGEVERIVFDEIDRLASTGVQADEVEKAVRQVRAQFVYASEGVTNQAYWLGDLELVARYQLLDEFVDRIAAVTPADVQRVAQTYLGRSNSTVGWFEPTALDGAAEIPHAPMQAFRRWWYSQPRRAEPTLAIKRQKLSNGAIVLGHERALTPAVVVQMSVQAGSMYDPAGKEGLAHFTAALMQRGTSRHTFQQISELTDRVGASLNASGLEHALQVGGRCLKDDLDLLIGLMVEILREPIFPATEIEKYRG